MGIHRDTAPNIEFPSYGRLFAGDLRSEFDAFTSLRQKVKDLDPSIVVTLGRDDFIHHVTLHMPEVAERIGEQDFGDLRREMSALRAATEAAINESCFHTVRRHLSFIGFLLEHADRALHDAIRECYLDPISSERIGSAALECFEVLD